MFSGSEEPYMRRRLIIAVVVIVLAYLAGALGLALCFPRQARLLRVREWGFGREPIYIDWVGVVGTPNGVELRGYETRLGIVAWYTGVNPNVFPPELGPPPVKRPRKTATPQEPSGAPLIRSKSGETPKAALGVPPIVKEGK